MQLITKRPIIVKEKTSGAEVRIGVGQKVKYEGTDLYSIEKWDVESVVPAVVSLMRVYFQLSPLIAVTDLEEA